MEKLVKFNSCTKDNSLTYYSLKKQFLYLKKAQGALDYTMRDYNSRLERFEKYYTNEYLEMEPLKEVLIELFSDTQKLAPATYNGIYSYLNAFFNWVVDNDYLYKNPIKILGFKKKKETGKIRNIPEDIIKRLLQEIDINTFVGLRDYALISLTLDTGIRPSEATGLRISNLDSEHFEIVVPADIAKTRQARTLPLSYQTVEILKNLISFRIPGCEDYIFLSVTGRKMSTDNWEDRLQKYSVAINYKITPYDFRHTFAIMYLRNGGNVFSLQRLLGHSNLEMTKRYVNFSQIDIANQHTNASPINNFIQRNTRMKRLIRNVAKEIKVNG